MRPGRHSPAGRTVPYLEEVTAMINDGDLLDGHECEQGYSRCTNTDV